MDTALEIRPHDYDALSRHLLPEEPKAEEAAFLFADIEPSADRIHLRVREQYLVPPREFQVRTLGRLDLQRDTHERMIRRAHDLAAAMVEVHSHPYAIRGAARFSLTDRLGLEENVPNVMWRLPARPYVAIVMAPEGLDALIWTERSGLPVTLGRICVGSRTIHPTANTLRKGWCLHGSL